MNGKGDAVATGSYNNLFRVFGTSNGNDLTLEASRDPMRKRLQTPPSKGSKGLTRKAATQSTEMGTDYASKLLHLAWHPEANVIAAAASNSLYMYFDS